MSPRGRAAIHARRSRRMRPRRASANCDAATIAPFRPVRPPALPRGSLLYAVCGVQPSRRARCNAAVAPHEQHAHGTDLERGNAEVCPPLQHRHEDALRLPECRDVLRPTSLRLGRLPVRLREMGVEAPVEGLERASEEAARETDPKAERELTRTSRRVSPWLVRGGWYVVVRRAADRCMRLSCTRGRCGSHRSEAESELSSSSHLSSELDSCDSDIPTTLRTEHTPYTCPTQTPFTAYSCPDSCDSGTPAQSCARAAETHQSRIMPRRKGVDSVCVSVCVCV